MRKAFTLLEINLAIMVMAGGILSILGLYGLGYRENSQSSEDVAATAYAEAVMSPLVAALSSTNVTWKAFNSIKDMPSDRGWGAYIDGTSGHVSQNPEAQAHSAFQHVMDKVGGEAKLQSTGWPTPSGDMKAGLVIRHDEGSAIVRIAFRATRLPAELLAMPIFYTEVRFQGKTELAQEGNE